MTGKRINLKDYKEFQPFRSKGFIYVMIPCPDCGEVHKVRFVKRKPYRNVCRKCAYKRAATKRSGINHPNWKGGKYKDANGYIRITLKPDDFFFSMARERGYLFEHRLVMAKTLGRCLHSWELVHHKNGIKDDNRIENLQLVSEDRHNQLTILERRISDLEKRITILEAENTVLKSQLEYVGYMRT